MAGLRQKRPFLTKKCNAALVFRDVLYQAEEAAVFLLLRGFLVWILSNAFSVIMDIII